MRSRLIDEYPSQTVDFIPFKDLTVDGAPVTDATGIETSVCKEFEDPTVWTPALAADGQIGFKVNGPTLGRGVFKAYARKTGVDVSPVIFAGYFRLY